MKKIFATIVLCAFALVFSANLSAQQGSWAGLVKYKLQWKGNVPQGVPMEWQTKVYKNLEGTDFSTYISLGGLMKTINNSANSTVTVMLDFSMFPDEGATEGMSGKWFFREKTELDKITERIEYKFTGETKEIAGVKCEKVTATVKGEGEEKDESEDCWVTRELGPKVCMTYFPGLEAFPMEFTMDITPEISVVFTAEEVLKGKVKEEDLMLEANYEEISSEDFREWMQKLQGSGEEDEDDDF